MNFRPYECATRLTPSVVPRTKMHSFDSRALINRLTFSRADSYAVASSVELILNQRLMRRVCVKCHGERCDVCLQTGYHGRVPVLEWLRLDAAQREQLRTRGPAGVLPKHSIHDAARELVRTGVTDAAEFERIFSR